MNESTKLQHHNNASAEGVVTVRKEERFSGPVPPPEVIERYERIYPGAAKMIFDNWDRQVTHRQGLEKGVVRTDNVKSLGGLMFGFIAVMTAIIAGAIVAAQGQTLFGSGLSLAGLAMLAIAFLTSRKMEKK